MHFKYFTVCCSCFSKVSLVATAPLTNVALAVKLDPSFPEKLKGLYIMGGNTACESLKPTTVLSEKDGAMYPILELLSFIYFKFNVTALN